MLNIEIKEESKDIGKKVVGTQISQEFYTKLKEDADKDFISISDVLRKIIYIYYSKNVKED